MDLFGETEQDAWTDRTGPGADRDAVRNLPAVLADAGPQMVRLADT